MPAPTGGTYILQFGLDFNTPGPNPGPWYLTSHGEGKQLTIANPTNDHNQEWNIQPIMGEKPDTLYRTITPALSPEIPAVSQDLVRFPDKVSLVKNLQVWSFEKINPSESVYEISSNLYEGIVGADPLLGVDLNSKDLNVIIQHIPVVAHPPPRPVWSLIPVNSKK